MFHDVQSSAAVRPDRVAMYIRWSTEDQGEGTTLQVQQEACELYVRSQGWVINPGLVFVDDGYSGGHLHRPAITRLRQAVKDGLVDRVIVFKLDRLSRSVVDTVRLVLDEWEGRCYLRSAREPIDTESPAGKMFFYLLASYAEWERNVIRERTLSGRLRRASEGKWASGPPPFGYRIGEGKRLEVDPALAGIVRAVYDAYLMGRSISDIVRQMQSDAAPAPAGPGQWTKPLVRRVLSNPIYAGLFEYGRLRTNPRHGRDPGAPRFLRASTPHVRRQGIVPAIVDGGTYAAVQCMKQERDARKTRRSGRAHSSRWLLSAIAKCARCGSSLAARGPRNGRNAFYFCLGRDHKLGCDCAQVPVRLLDDWFADELRRVYGDAVRWRRALAPPDEEHRRRIAVVAAAVPALRAEVEKLARERAVMRRRLRGDEVTIGEYREFMREIDGELDGQQQRLRGLEEELSTLRAAARVDGLAADLAAVDVFDALDPADRKHLVQRLVASLRVYRAPRGGEVESVVEWRVTVGGAATPPASVG